MPLCMILQQYFIALFLWLRYSFIRNGDCPVIRSGGRVIPSGIVLKSFFTFFVNGYVK